MRPVIHSTAFLITLSAVFLGFSLTAKGAPNLNQLQSRHNKQRSIHFSLWHIRGKIRKELMALEKRIALRKRVLQSFRSIRGDAQLKILLRSHRKYSIRISNLDKVLRKSLVKINTIRQELIQATGSEIMRLTTILKKIARKKEKINTQRQLRQLILSRRALTNLYHPSTSYGDIKITIDPDDGPDEIREKANLLKDNEERIRRRVTHIEKRIKKLMGERRLLEESSDFLDERSMFDPDMRGRRTTLATTTKTTPTPSATGNPHADNNGREGTSGTSGGSPTGGYSTLAGSGTAQDTTTPGNTTNNNSNNSNNNNNNNFAAPSPDDGKNWDEPRTTTSTQSNKILQLGPNADQVGRPGISLSSKNISELKKEKKRLLALAKRLLNRYKKLNRRAHKLEKKEQ